MTATSTLQPSTGITDIAGRAMLVGLTIRQFNPTITDKTITADVNARLNVAGDQGKYQKALIVKSRMKALSAYAGEVRTEHYRRTLPWAEDGARILTSAGYFEYAEWMRTAEAKWAGLVREFLNEWDTLVDEARVKLGSAFNPSDYPTFDQLKGKFDFRWSVRPVPVADDFRVALGASEVAAIRSDIKASLDATVQDAMRDVWGRMRDVVGKMAERLRAYDPNNPREAPFRDSLVGNISELLDVLPSLNLTGDSAVSSFTAQMRELTQHDAQKLRDDMFIREDTAKRAEQIYTAMSAFIA